MIDPLATPQTSEYPGFLVMPLRGDENGHRLADNLFGGIAKDALC